MKRLLVAAGLVLLTVTLIVVGTLAKNRDIDRLLDRLDDIEAAFLAQETDLCRARITAFPDEVERTTRYFHAIVPHDEIHALYESAAALPVLYGAGDPAELLAELSRCRTRLELLREAGVPVPENILTTRLRWAGKR